MFKTILLRLGLAVTLLVAVGSLWLKKQSDITRLEAEWRSLTRMTHLITERPVPYSWAMGVYVSSKGLNRFLTAAKDVRVSFDPTTVPDEDTILTVKALNIEVKPGFASGAIQIQAVSKKRNLVAFLDGEAALIFKEIIFDSTGRPFARFAIQPLNLLPRLLWKTFNVSAGKYASEVLASGVSTTLSNAMIFNIPLPDTPTVELSIPNKRSRIPVRAPESENWVDLVANFDSGKLSEELSFAHPIFIDGGMWIVAGRRPQGRQPSETIDHGDRNETRMEQEIAAMRAVVANIQPPAAGAGDVAIWLQGPQLAGLINKVGTLPPERRRITIDSDGYGGRLAEDKWNDRILGDGGAYVALNKPHAVTASVAISNIGAQWRPSEGLALASQIAAHSETDIHLHVDPLIGGGVGTDVKMVGDLAANITGTVAISVQKVGTHALLVMVPKLDCRDIQFEMKTDGKFAGDWGWTKVPPIGGRLTTPLPSALFTPQLLLTDAPFVVKPDDQQFSKPFLVAGRLVRVDVPRRALQVTLQPLESLLTPDGLLVSVASDVTPLLEPPAADPSDAAAKRLRDEAAKIAGTAACGGDTHFALVLGPLEFGPNHEVIKFIRNAWNDITKGPGKENEVIKLLDRMNSAAKDYDDATKNLANEIGGLARRAFPTNSAVGHAAGELGKSVTIVLTNPTAAAQGFVRQLLRGFH